MEKVLISFFALFMLMGAPLNAASKEELAAIERQAKEKEAQLKKYKAREAALSKELKALTQKQKQTYHPSHYPKLSEQYPLHKPLLLKKLLLLDYGHHHLL